MDLEASEISDLFQSVQRVGKVIEQAYGAQGLNVSVQVGIPEEQSSTVLRKDRMDPLQDSRSPMFTSISFLVGQQTSAEITMNCTLD